MCHISWKCVLSTVMVNIIIYSLRYALSLSLFSGWHSLISKIQTDTISRIRSQLSIRGFKEDITIQNAWCGGWHKHWILDFILCLDVLLWIWIIQHQMDFMGKLIFFSQPLTCRQHYVTFNFHRQLNINWIIGKHIPTVRYGYIYQDGNGGITI